MLEDKEIMLIQNEDGTTEKTAQTSKTDYLRCIKWRH